MSVISCPACGSDNVLCVTDEDLVHDHRCFDCGHKTIPCEVCAHADRTGSWVDAPGFDGLTHCRKCHESWPRAAEMQHCTVCHQTFTGPSPADKHLRNGVHLDAATALDKKGRRIFAESTRRRNDRVTVTVWATAGERPWTTTDREAS